MAVTVRKRVPLMKMELKGAEQLSAALRRKSSIRWDAVCKKNLTEMRNRAVSSQDPGTGGTPVDSGELRQSVEVVPPNGDGLSGEIGYLKEYAPHVEYGRRTLDGGFIQGQHNVDIQSPIFRQDLIENIRKA